jgi:hypothetical protein
MTEHIELQLMSPDLRGRDRYLPHLSLELSPDFQSRRSARYHGNHKMAQIINPLLRDRMVKAARM